MEELNYYCKTLENFSKLADHLRAEMSSKAFRVSDEEYAAMKIKYQYLSELETIIRNLSIEENNE